MNNIMLFKNTSYLLRIFKFVYMLIFITHSCGSATIDDLKFICNLQQSIKKSPVKVSDLPNYCTSVSTFIDDLDTKISIFEDKGTLKAFAYIAAFEYDEWSDKLNDINPFTKLIQREKLDGLIFDNLFSDKKYDKEMNQKIVEFFTKLKASNCSTLFGLTLPKNADQLCTAFDYDSIDCVVDFYVIKTQDYSVCTLASPMKKATTADDMENSLIALNSTIPASMYKTLLIVQLVVLGVSTTNNYVSTFSYSDLCGYNNKVFNDVDNWRFCKDSLYTLWKKAFLCHQYKMLGVLIEDSDLDDHAGSCGCFGADLKSTFPGNKAIYDGSHNTEENISLDCDSFGNIYNG